MRQAVARTRAAVVALIVLVGTVLVASPPARAAAAEPSITVRADGAVRARGAAVVAVLTLTCRASGTIEFISVEVTQKLTSGKLVHGSGEIPGPTSCSPTPRSLRVALTATGFDEPVAPPFHAGAAFVSATLVSCADPDCFDIAQTTSGRTVTLADVALELPKFASDGITLRQLPKASWEAQGAGALTRVAYTCPKTRFLILDVFLDQRTSAHLVTGGFTEVRLSCPGLRRTAVAAIHAEAAPWVKGSAYTTLFAQACSVASEGSCEPVYAHATVTLL
jgi:hypothetical protein